MTHPFSTQGAHGPHTAALILLLLLQYGVTLAAGASSVRVAVISDLNGAYGSTSYGRDAKEALDAIIGLRPDLVISTGDMIAAQRPQLLPRERVGLMWSAFDRDFAAPLLDADIPLAVSPGNHDASVLPRFISERAQFAHRWQAQRGQLDLVDAGNYPFQYAFAKDDVLFIGLDATATSPMPDAEFDWLAGVLRNAKNHYRYTVVFGHVPLWPFTRGREREVTRDLRLHALLVESGVNLYLSGHHHAFYPGVLDGVAYVSQACLGAGPRPRIGEDQPAPRAFTWIEFNDSGIRLASVTGRHFDATEVWSGLPGSLGVGEPRLLRADRSDPVISELPYAELRGAAATLK